MESMMTARQVAELLGVHENWVYDQAAAGVLPSYKIGGTRRFDPDEVRRFIAEHRQPSARAAEPTRTAPETDASERDEAGKRLADKAVRGMSRPSGCARTVGR